MKTRITGPDPRPGVVLKTPPVASNARTPHSCRFLRRIWTSSVVGVSVTHFLFRIEGNYWYRPFIGVTLVNTNHSGAGGTAVSITCVLCCVFAAHHHVLVSPSLLSPPSPYPQVTTAPRVCSRAVLAASMP